MRDGACVSEPPSRPAPCRARGRGPRSGVATALWRPSRAARCRSECGLQSALPTVSTSRSAVYGAWRSWPLQALESRLEARPSCVLLRGRQGAPQAPQAEVWVVVRIPARNLARPASEEPWHLDSVVSLTSGLRFFVDEFSERCVHDEPAAVAYSQAVIDVAERDRKLLAETSE